MLDTMRKVWLLKSCVTIFVNMMYLSRMRNIARLYN
ncbi:hypothetical protein PA15_0321705 [Pseudomonas aeruginosa HB15]|nr:hypothetical protein PA15_0321705 [Pseudomonas aeruginosa HB15]KAJ05457.1 hypothetical protein M002_29650 [Pseudomonas aeruginosa ID4365]